MNDLNLYYTCFAEIHIIENCFSVSSLITDLNIYLS